MAAALPEHSLQPTAPAPAGCFGRSGAHQARRAKFFRNGDRFFQGLTIAISKARYRSLDSVLDDLTRSIGKILKIAGAVRHIFTLTGEKVSNLNQFEHGKNYVCCFNNEKFKSIKYNLTSKPVEKLMSCSKKQNGASNSCRRPLPTNNEIRRGGNDVAGGDGNDNHAEANAKVTRDARTARVAEGASLQKTNKRDGVMQPRIVALIRNGPKPRKVHRLLLNKRTSPSFEQVLATITNTMRFSVRRVLTLTYKQVKQLVDFFGLDFVFLVFGTNRINPSDFELHVEEEIAIRQICRNISDSAVIFQPFTIDKYPPMLSEKGIDIARFPVMIRKRFLHGKNIAQSSHAAVLKIEERLTGLQFALKIIHKGANVDPEICIDSELRIMSKIQHPHIVSFIMAINEPALLYLVLEYFSGGDLFETLQKVKRFSEAQSRLIMSHLTSAMVYLHSKNIVHRDIKLENLLVEFDSSNNITKIKLADFGYAREVTKPLFTICGTTCYMAPELVQQIGYGLKVDVWSAGVLLYEILCGNVPFNVEKKFPYEEIIAGQYQFPDFPKLSKGVRQLIDKMLRTNPEERFSSEDVLNHYWFLEDDCSD